jgi:hypothetical protein
MFLRVLVEASGGHVRSCAELMCQRSVCCANLLNADLVNRCVESLRAYLRLGAQQPAELREMAALFVRYLSTHSVDPDNALVGQKVSARALKARGSLCACSI